MCTQVCVHNGDLRRLVCYAVCTQVCVHNRDLGSAMCTQVCVHNEDLGGAVCTQVCVHHGDLSGAVCTQVCVHNGDLGGAGLQLAQTEGSHFPAAAAKADLEEHRPHPHRVLLHELQSERRATCVLFSLPVCHTWNRSNAFWLGYALFQKKGLCGHRDC